MKKLRMDSDAVEDRLCAVVGCGIIFEMLCGSDVMHVLRLCRLVRNDTRVLSSGLRRLAADPRWMLFEMHRLVQTPRCAMIAVSLIVQMQRYLDSQRVDKRVYPFLLLRSPDGSIEETLRTTGLLPFAVTSSPETNTVFGLHWDNASDDVETCALCDAAVSSVCEYREATQAFLNAFERQLQDLEAQWETQGDSTEEIVDKSYAFQETYFQHEPYYNTYVANQNDMAVLDHICTSHRFSYSSVPLSALTTSARSFCWSLVRPLKQLLSTLSDSPLVHMVTSDSSRQNLVVGATEDVIVGFVLGSPDNPEP